jgi:hypothetical protein
VTELLHGNRELLVASKGNARLIVFSDGEMTESDFLGVWHRRKLKADPIAVLNPPGKPPKDFKAIQGNYLLFDDQHKLYANGLTKEWSVWARSNKVQITTLRELNPTLLQQAFTTGAFGVTFTAEAAEWYTRVVGTSMVRQQYELDKLLTCGVTEVDLETALQVIGGAEETKAERILRALGTPLACRLVTEVSNNNAYRLFTYLEIPLRNKKSPWVIGLIALRRAMEIKTLDAQSAIQLFAQYCLKSKAAGDSLSSLSELLRIARLQSG